MLDTWPGLQTTSVQRSKQIMHKCPTFIQTKQECPALQADKSRKAQSSECMDERSRRHAWWLPDTHSHWQALRRKQAGCCSTLSHVLFSLSFFPLPFSAFDLFFWCSFLSFPFSIFFSFFPILLLFPFVLSRSFLTSFLPFSSSSRNFFSHHFFSLSHLLSLPPPIFLLLPPTPLQFISPILLLPSLFPFYPFLHSSSSFPSISIPFTIHRNGPHSPLDALSGIRYIGPRVIGTG